MVKGVGENKQPRHRAVGFATQLVADLLHALGGAKIDIDHYSGQFAGGRGGDIRRRDAVNLPDRLQNVDQFAAVIASIGRQQQPALG